MSDFDMWGLIPSFLSTSDPRSATEQFNANYQSGWQHFDGFTLNPRTLALSYPGDPPLNPLSAMAFRTERIFLYPGEWVMVMQPDDSWEICRMT